MVLGVAGLVAWLVELSVGVVVIVEAAVWGVGAVLGEHVGVEADGVAVIPLVVVPVVGVTVVIVVDWLEVEVVAVVAV